MDIDGLLRSPRQQRGHHTQPTAPVVRVPNFGGVSHKNHMKSSTYETSLDELPHRPRDKGKNEDEDYFIA
ncbi:MAG: hypothetical protein OJF50_005888 [Nitrospira sp.]|jgi:hypothetical protein|nr:hypothetical protein [Nitrospira sp.]